MSKIADAEANATSLDGFACDNGLIPTLRNGPKPSWQYLVDGWNAEIDLTLDQYKESRGFNTKGTFAGGFTYELPNDVGLDAGGNPWILIDTSSLPVTVTAGTTPTNPPYKQVIYGTASQVSTNTSDTVQSFIDSFALKIFQSPTAGGLTEIQTRTVGAGEVYEVRKTYDNSLATIYSDAAGANEIVQNVTSNVSDSAGVVEFYIADGDYYVEVDNVQSGFSVKINQGKVDFTYFGFSESETVGGEEFLSALQYASDRRIEIDDSGTYTVEFSSAGNADMYRLTGMPTIHVVGWDNCSIKLINNSALYANFTTSEVATDTLIRSDSYLDTVSISTDVSFTGDITGVTRVSKFLRVGARVVNCGKITAYGFITPYIFESRPDAVCEFFSALNVSVKNTQTGLYLSGDANLPLAVDDSGWFEKIQVDNISIVNTEQQQSNYTSIPGSDGILIEGYNNVCVGTIYSERAIERAMYANTGYGSVTVGGYTLKNSSGIKVVGYVNHDVVPNIDVIVKSVEIGKGVSSGGPGSFHDSYGRAVILYDAEDVTVGKINMSGSFEGVDDYMETAILLQRYLKNITIEGVTGRNIRNAPVVIDQADSSGVSSIMENISISGISVINPSIASDRYLIDVIQPATAAMRNLRLVDNYGKSKTEFGINENDFNTPGYKNISRLLGLINIEYCAGLTMEGNVIDGYSQSVSSDRTIGASCTSVKITDSIIVPTIGFIDDLTIRASNGSEIVYKAYLTSNNGSYTVKVSPIRLSDNITPTRLDLKSRANLEGYLTLVSQGEQIYPINTTNNLICSGKVYGDNGEFIEFTFDGVTITKTGGTSEFIDTNTDGVNCVYVSSEGFILRNRTDSTVSYNIELNYSRWDL